MKLSFYIKVWRRSRSTLDSNALWFVTYKRDITRMTSSIESNANPLLHCWSLVTQYSPLYILQCLQLHCYFFSWACSFTHILINLACLEEESRVQYIYWYCVSIFRAIFNPILNGFCWSCNFLRIRVKRKNKTTYFWCKNY